VHKHYGSIKDIPSEEELPEGEEVPFSQADFYIKMAKLALKTDNYLLTTAFLFTEGDGSPCMMSSLPKDRAELHLFMDQLADKVEETHANAIVFSGEIWTLSLEDDPDALKIRPSESKHKTEAILITMATPKRTVLFEIPFSRNIFGKIIFGKLKIIEGKFTPFLNRIYKIWTEGSYS
jgi:hypothetical protein